MGTVFILTKYQNPKTNTRQSSDVRLQRGNVQAAKQCLSRDLHLSTLCKFPLLIFVLVFKDVL